MHRFSALLTAILLVLASAGLAHAGPIITFTAGNGTGGGATNINNGNAFPIALGGTGGAVDAFVNNTMKIIKDFHFTWTNNQNNVVGEDDFAGGGVATAFGSFTSAATTLDFFDAPGGAGIGKGQTFTITVSGLGNNKNMNIMANATFTGGKGTNSTKSPFGAIPEPASFTLLGVAAVALLAMKRSANMRLPK